MTSPALLNSLSHGTEVPTTTKYFKDIWYKCRYSAFNCCQSFKGHFFLSITGELRYCRNSVGMPSLSPNSFKFLDVINSLCTFHKSYLILIFDSVLLFFGAIFFFGFNYLFHEFNYFCLSVCNCGNILKVHLFVTWI